MLQNDYILRIIEQFAEVLRRVLKRKQEKKFDEAAQELDEVAQGLVGMDLKTLGGMSVQALRVCAPEPQRSALLARAFKEYGEILEITHGEAQAVAFYKKAFVLYDALDQHGELPEQGDHLPALQWLVTKLDGFTHPAATGQTRR